MALWQMPFLLSFYPAPGMNDTVFMMENPLYASVQFPWLYSVIYGYGAGWGKEVLGSREPVIFFLFSAAASFDLLWAYRLCLLGEGTSA